VCGTKADPVEGEHLLYSFITSEPNGVVGPIHPKAMPVIVTTPEEFDVWLNAPTEEALKLQRALPIRCFRSSRRETNQTSQLRPRVMREEREGRIMCFCPLLALSLRTGLLAFSLEAGVKFVEFRDEVITKLRSELPIDL
jgi:hypothetical protein